MLRRTVARSRVDVESSLSRRPRGVPLDVRRVGVRIAALPTPIPTASKVSRAMTPTRTRKLSQVVTSVARSTVSHVLGLERVLRFDASRPMSMAANLDHWARKDPSRIFLKFEGRRISWGRFNDRVARRAAAFRKLGLDRGAVVAVLMPNRPAFLVDVLALNRIGAVAALVNTSLRGSALRHAVLVTEPVAAVCDGSLTGALFEAFDEQTGGGALPFRVFVDLEGGSERPAELGSRPGVLDLVATDDALAPGARAPLVEVPGTDVAAYIYTSGTTGLPKAGKVLHARTQIAGYAFGLAIPGMRRDDTLYCCLPMFHSNGFLVALGSALVAGASFALARRFSASRFWTDIVSAEATCFCYIGEICRYLLAAPPHPEERAHRLRYIIGNGMRPEVWTRFVERFRPGRVLEFYGATEGNVNMINPFGRVGSCGRMPPGPLDNALLVRFDHDLQEPVRGPDGRCIPCSPGEVGELLGRINEKRVTQRFDGYLNDDATRGKVLRDVLEPGDAWFRSGDLLKRDKFGWYYFVDRIGDTFRWKGENVSTNEVADVIGAAEGVEIANVYGVAVPGADGRCGMVALVMRRGAAFDPVAFYAHVARDLPSYAQPGFVRIVDTAELTATFKLKKNELVRDAFDPSRVTDALFVRDDALQRYVPLDAAVYEQLCLGRWRL